ncbi:Cytochrome P450 monooxygenase [Fulvia fulva]|uniref:Cytochrome P450 monooxygenase n=1 Tax=Passalora fulva TaxID=5499 RepID=A0A9Q8LGV4_PASFU|nr:Cytochrome P450 monooxygenase [Fulvia fulva]KAK4627014.1 Cytochrome P450 monooxygenase [Fulvia fulva]UJO16388.1 Cytochrome P450 monooxygenase [Fulvia fulva]WPV14354.1 Cytochrome P450 monooxygenase [Fulvia fulva]WPV29067.1 Cytochrome P450 monooxygenase [Fulvia fulva]
MASLKSALLAVGTGVASHLFYFRIGEHHMMPVMYLQLISLACIASTFALVNFTGATVLGALSTVAAFAACWFTGVYGSLLTYRLLFHPLNEFAGPWQARLGDLWMSSQLTGLNAYHVFDDLHKRHGRFVRVGSNTLSITDPDTMQPAYGANARVTKADWYDGSVPHHSMHTTRDKGLHDRRRRVWAPAFSDKALREYEATVQEFNDKLVEKVAEAKGSPMNMTTWFNLYSFDVMGRLAFGKDYGMIESGKRHWALDLLTEGMGISAYKIPTWVFRILLSIPGAAQGYHKFLKFCSDELRWRVKNGKNFNKDITGWLLKAYAGEAHPEEDPMLQGDARLIIVAGSDTTSATLTYLFYHLAQDPSHVKKLRDELRPLTQGEWSDKDIQHADHLNGAINEALRLHPPVPSGIMRKTPPEGVQLGDVYIPGNITFCTPLYPMGRDDRIYPQADSFVPERWYSKPDMVKHQDAFAPFSMGPFNCIGRNLARMELRTLTAQLLLKYDVAFAPGEDGTRILTKTKDHFTVSVGQLDLGFKPVSS